MQSAKGSGVKSFSYRAWRTVRWPLGILVLAYIGLVIYRIPAVREQDASKAAVAEIQAQKLTMADVDGKHLPPPPDPAQVNATVAGIDANSNGIRDDVELAIFAKYPGKANEKLRAAELQYAMELQTELSGEIFDNQTWTAVAKKENNGISCLVSLAFNENSDVSTGISKSDKWQREVRGVVFNTPSRRDSEAKVSSYQTSFATGIGSCDLPIET